MATRSPEPRSQNDSNTPLRLVSLLVAAIAGGFTTVDADLWGHLRFGLDLLDDWKLRPLDRYSFTDDLPWINHEWLSEGMFALAYRSGGTLGLLLVRAAIVLVVLTVMARALRGLPARYRWPLFAFGSFSVVPGISTVRPQLFTQLGIALLAFLLVRPTRWRAALLPLLFAFWANVHGGWLVGLGVLGMWAMGRLLEEPTRRVAIECVWLLALSLAATLVTPYGLRLWTFLGATVRPARDAADWMPIWRQTTPAYALLWGGTTAWAAWACSKRPRLSCILPLALLGVMSLRVGRLVPVFGELAVCLCGPLWTRQAPRSTAWAVRILEAVAVALIVVRMAPREGFRPCLALKGHPWVPDQEAMLALKEHAAPGRLVLPYSWGQYALWHLGPRLLVSTDGRRETIYSDRVLAEQDAILIGDAAGVSFLDRERPEYVWLPLEGAGTTRRWLETHGYRVDVTTARSFVATRNDLPTIGDAIERTTSCFP